MKSSFLLSVILVIPATLMGAEATVVEVHPRNLHGIQTPAVGPAGHVASSASVRFDPARGMVNVGGTWIAGVQYDNLSLTGPEVRIELEFTPYGSSDGHLISLVSPNDSGVTLEMVRRGRFLIRERRGSRTIPINWPRNNGGPRQKARLALVWSTSCLRYEMDNQTVFTAPSTGVRPGQYQLRVGWRSAKDPGAAGWYAGWRVTQRDKESAPRPMARPAIPAPALQDLMGLEAKVSALQGTDISGPPARLSLGQMRAAAAAVALDSLWYRAYTGKRDNFAAYVRDLNRFCDRYRSAADSQETIPLPASPTGPGWLVSDRQLHFGGVGWDLSPYLDEFTRLGFNEYQTSVKPDQVYGSKGAKWDQTYIEGCLISNLDNAQRYGAKMDVLLSPFFPPFLIAKHPEWAGRCGHSFLKGCILDPEYRAMCREYIPFVVKRLKGHPGLGSYCLGNEIQFEEYCPRAQEAFRTFLRTKYGTLDGLAAAWREQYPSWETIRIDRMPGYDRRNLARLSDWLALNHQIGSDYIRFLKDLVRSIDPDTPVHVKTLPHDFGLPGEDATRMEYDYPDGVDRRTLAGMTEIIGTDSWADGITGEGSLATDAIRQLMYFDLLHGYAPGKPIFDSEWHILNTDKPTPPAYARALMTLDAVHHLRAGTLWLVTPEIDKADLVSHAGLLYQCGLTAATLRRLHREIGVLADRPTPIALLYSPTSRYLDGDEHYLALKRLYELGQYTGLGITLLDERDLVAGNTQGIKAIIAAICPHAAAGTAEALDRFAAAGGKLVALGAVAAMTPEGKPQLRRYKIHPFAKDDASLPAIYNKLADALHLDRPVRLVRSDGTPPTGVIWHYAADADGRTILFACNIGKTPARLRWDTAGQIRDLVSGRPAEKSFELPSLDVLLETVSR